MKKIIPILLAGLLLAGCGHTADIGIIGGADGPTAIVVGTAAETTACTEMPDLPGIPVPPGTFAEGWEEKDGGMIYIKTTAVSEASYRSYAEETLPAAGFQGNTVSSGFVEDVTDDRVDAVLCEGTDYMIQLLYAYAEETLTVTVTQK